MLTLVLLLSLFVPKPQAPVDPAFVIALSEAASDAARKELLDARAASLTLELQRAMYDKAVELRRAGRLPASGYAFLSARDIAERLGDRARAALALVGYSSVPGTLGDVPAAFAALNEALAIGEALQNNNVIGAALTNLSIVHGIVGDYDSALDANRRSLELAVAADDRAMQARIHNGNGIIYSRQGHFREALESYERVLALEKNPMVSSLALSNVGNVHVQQGNLDLAVDYYTRALEGIRTSGGGESPDAAAQLNNIGLVYKELNSLDRALPFFEQAQAINEKLAIRPGMASAALNIGQVRERQGRTDEALELFRKSLALREAMNDRVGIRVALHSLGMLFASLGRHAEALAAEERAVALARDMRSTELLWEPLQILGDIRRAMGDRAAAEAAYREAIDTIEAIRKEVAGGSETRRRFFEDKLAAYHGLTAVLIDGGRTGEALRVAELARGRVLAEQANVSGVATRALTADELSRQRALQRDVVTLSAAVKAAERRPAGATGGSVDDTAERLRKAQRSADEFRDALDARYPKRRLARGDESVDPIAAGGQLLADGRTAIVEYVVTSAATHIFVLSRSADGTTSVAAFEAPVARAALQTQVGAFRAKLASRALDFHANARALYDILLKPARAALAGRTRLIVIPDDVLWTIPFEVLEPSAGRALIDTAAVAYAPSIAVLRDMHERRIALAARGGAPTLVVAADPAGDLPKLPDAGRQAAALTTLYGASRSRTFVGAAATEPAVRAALTGATVLHFATHGVVDDANPMYSFLQLTQTGQRDPDTDGRLETWEVWSLQLNAAVAVLTACDTARGTIGGGEGVIGLAWAFFAAGTPSTVVSLWPLESGSATTLTLALHRRLRASLVQQRGAVAESLRQAALELRRDPRYKHPFYWAGLVAVGDGY